MPWKEIICCASRYGRPALPIGSLGFSSWRDSPIEEICKVSMEAWMALTKEMMLFLSVLMSLTRVIVSNVKPRTANACELVDNN
jgi:hypothetical protein